MSRKITTSARMLLTGVLFGGAALAQSTSPATTPATVRRPAAPPPTAAQVARPGDPAPAPAEEAVVLSAFEVRESDDQGYLATSAQSGTRLRSDLKDIAASVSVITKDFMNDIGARNVEDLLTYTLNTEVGGVGGNFSEAISTVVSTGSEMNFDSALGNVSPGTRVRGLTSADSTRDFFITDVPLDSYNTDRIEINRGPNAMLFGLGSPAGIINSALITADTRRIKTRVEYRTDQYGSYRGALDHNYALIKDKLALRLATVYDKSYYKIEEAYNETKRGYLTATYRPFKNTRIKASTEWATQDSNRPRIAAPYDAYSWWWEVGKPVYNPSTGTLTLLSTPRLVSALTATGGRNSNVVITAVGPLGGTNHMGLIFSDPNSSELGIPGTNVVGFRSGQIANVHPNAAGTALVADGWMAIADTARILNGVVHAAATDPTRNYWRNYQVTDPKIYDFYHHMLDGPNKYEWSRWKTYNVTLEQVLLEGRAGLEVSFNRQNLDSGSVLPYTSQSAYSLRLDINSTLPNGAPNPNFGRPLVVGFQSASLAASDREAARATGYYNLDLTQRGPGWLRQVLGKHLLTATHTRLDNRAESYSGAFAFNSDVKYSFDNQGSLNDASTQGRDVSLVHYIGPSALGASSPVGGLATPTGQWPSNVKNVNILWYTSPTSSTAPANQWEVRNYGLISSGRYDVDNTRRASGIRRTRTQINSTSFVTQDKFFNGKLVGTVGWRRDDVFNYDAGTAVRDPATGIGVNDPKTFYPKRVSDASEKTFSWGVVGHAPEVIQRRLPFGSEISLTYNQADNFRPAGQRYDLYDTPLGPEVGETKEYGVLFSTFHGKLVLRAAHYETTAAKSSSLVSLGTPLQALADGLDRVADQNLRGLNDSNPAGLAAYRAWVATPAGQTLYKTFRITENPTTGRVDYDRRTGQVVGTADVVSTGMEYEVIFNPTRSWRIAFNAGKSEAIRSNTGLDMQALVGTIATLIQGPAGTLRQEDNGTTFGNSMQANVIVPMLQVTTQDGSPTSELRKWRWNFINNYTFTGGRLKGVKVGGAVRWQDRVAIGFPVMVDRVAGAIPDVKHPYYGPTEVNYDAWIGYGRRLKNRVGWDIQLNVKNIGVGSSLIPVSAQPDGSINAYRIAEAMKWTLTNSFTF
jgi:hypothetical protein